MVRSKNWRENIVIDSAVLTGKPIIKGLKVNSMQHSLLPTCCFMRTESEILRNYLGLAHENIQAFWMYASYLLRTERGYPVNISHKVD
ncbi:hypothetical protein MSBR2_0941 [Methanosarcina barkeri 227]|uniref:Uncharacterized protein n=2 Tax=Methanosarcina barkeri TaxID=2208 RepID=A0A0E3QT19_METBA|nr:hypothetical protein MSBRM_1460 [Methanosarcina barkeri MS]AKB57457.1 hypothetical protein MSBR2_0941 [Methanosarcina barkeri 227]